MNRFCLPCSLLLAMAWTGGVPSAPGQEKAPPPRHGDCSKVLAKMKEDLAREPGRLLLSMEDALTTDEVCVCPIVRMAINFAGSDHGLAAEVVVTAVRMVPAAAARVVECATAEAPDAAPAIREAISRELGEKGPALLETGTPPSPPTAKDPDPLTPPAASGKAPVPASPDPDLKDAVVEEWPAVGVSGIFYAPMPRGSLAATPERLSGTKKTITIRTIKIVPRRPVSPVTRCSPE